MSDFMVVPDELREIVRSSDKHARNPDVAAVMDGRTIFIPVTGRTVSEAASIWHSRISNASHKTKRAVTRKHSIDGQLGILVWAEDR